MFNKLKKNEFLRVFCFFGKRFWVYIMALLCDKAINAICFNIVFAFIVKDLFNAAFQMNMELLFRAVLIVVVSTVIACVFQPLSVYLFGISIKSTMVDIRKKVFKKIHELPVKNFENSHTGDFILRVTGDIDSIESLFKGQVSSLVFTIILGVSAIISIIILDWRIGLPLIAIGILLTITNVLFSKSLRRKNDRIRVLYSNMVQGTVDLFSSMHLAKIFRLEKLVHNKVAKRNHQFTDECKSIGNTYAWLNSINAVFSQLSTTGLIGVGVFMLINDYIDIGTVMAIYALQGNMNSMFSSIGGFVTGIQSSLAGVHRIFEILDCEIEYEQQEQVLREKLDLENLTIEFSNVNFSYNNTTKALKNFNIIIGDKKSVALVGESGSGKSTIVKLLLGFYKITEGCIRIGGKPIQDFSLSQLRHLTAYVPQDPVIFNDTIYNNILFGRMDATKEEVIQAAKAANAHEFIVKQSEDYNSIVSEKGRNLSGGQKQRIAIARALLKNAPILILDEATSALDSESEELIQKAIKNISKDRTVLFIAHRLSTVMNSDVVYVIDKGRVLEWGNHEELILRDGVYKNLFNKQVLGKVV